MPAQPCRARADRGLPIPWLHDPTQRAVALVHGDWEVRVLRRSAPRYRRLLRQGGLHVQLWNSSRRISVVTPCALSGQCFEVCAAGGLPTRVAKPKDLRTAVADRYGVELPMLREIAMFVGWFVLAEQRRATARTSRKLSHSRNANPESARPVPLAACRATTLRQLVIFLAAFEPASLDRLAPGAKAVPSAAPSCERVRAAAALLWRTAEGRRRLDAVLRRTLGDLAQPFRSCCLAELARTWESEREHLRGARLAALLWVVAREPSSCYRKLEDKLLRHIDASRRWVLIEDGLSPLVA